MNSFISTGESDRKKNKKRFSKIFFYFFCTLLYHLWRENFRIFKNLLPALKVKLHNFIPSPRCHKNRQFIALIICALCTLGSFALYAQDNLVTDEQVLTEMKTYLAHLNGEDHQPSRIEQQLALLEKVKGLWKIPEFRKARATSLDELLRNCKNTDAYFLSAVAFHDEQIEDHIEESGPNAIVIADSFHLTPFEIELIQRAYEFRSKLRGGGYALAASVKFDHPIFGTLSVGRYNNITLLSTDGSMTRPLLEHTIRLTPGTELNIDVSPVKFSNHDFYEKQFEAGNLSSLVHLQHLNYLFFTVGLPDNQDHLFFAHPSIDCLYLKPVSKNGIPHYSSLAISETSRSTDRREELRLAAIDTNRKIYLWTVDQGTMNQNRIEEEPPIELSTEGIAPRIELSPFGKYLAVYKKLPSPIGSPFYDSIEVIELASRKTILQRKYPILNPMQQARSSEGIMNFKFVSTDDILYLLMRDGTVEMINLADPKDHPTFFPSPKDLISATAITESPDFSIAIGYSDGTIKIWNSSAHKAHTVIQDPSVISPIIDLAFIDEMALVSLSENGRLHIWHIDIPTLDLGKIFLIDPASLDGGDKK